MNKAFVALLLMIALVTTACSEVAPKTVQQTESQEVKAKQSQINMTEQAFELYDTITGVSEWDLKDDAILWVGVSAEHPKLTHKNLTSGEIKSIEFTGSRITEPKIAGKHMAFRRQYSPNNFSDNQVHTWNPETNEVVMVTCGWHSGYSIVSADNDLLLLESDSQYLLDVSQPRECDLWRNVTIKVRLQSGAVQSEIVETQPRYIGPDYVRAEIVKDSKPALPLMVVCNPEPDSCRGTSQYTCSTDDTKFACPTDEPFMTSFDWILADEKVLLGKPCFTYKYADHPIIETTVELLQAAKFAKVNCLTVHDGKGLEVTFNISTLKFDARQYELVETPNYKRYGIEKFHPLIYLSVPANEQLLAKLKNIPTTGYSVCTGKRDKYENCLEWDVYVAVYSSITKDTLTFYGGRFFDKWGAFKGDYYQAYVSGDVVKEGETSSKTILQLREAFDWQNPWHNSGSGNSAQHSKAGKSSKGYLVWQDYDDNLYIWKLPE